MPPDTFGDETRLPADKFGRLTATQITKALGYLNDELVATGQRLQIGIVGGAALALGFQARASTNDVDVWTDNPEVLRQAAEAVAQRHHLPKDWISAEASRFIPVSANRFTTWITTPQLTVMIAQPQVLLAMKLEAARRKDLQDIRFLCGYLGIASWSKAVTIHRTYYRRELSPDVQVLLRGALADCFRLP